MSDENKGVMPDRRLRGLDRKRADQSQHFNLHTGQAPGAPRHAGDGHPGPAGAAGRDLPRQDDSKGRG